MLPKRMKYTIVGKCTWENMILKECESVSFGRNGSTGVWPFRSFCVTLCSTLLQPPVTDVTNVDLSSLAGHTGDVTYFIRHFSIHGYQVGRLQLSTLNVCLNLERKRHHTHTLRDNHSTLHIITYSFMLRAIQKTRSISECCLRNPRTCPLPPHPWRNV